MAEEITVGRVGGAYGVRGWVRINSFTDPVDSVLRYSPWEIRLPGTTDPLSVTVIEGRVHKKGCVARLDVCQDRDSAEALAGADIVIARDRLPPTDDGEYYWADLIGCAVVLRDGTKLGQVERMLATGANDVLVVAGEREFLLPFVSDTVILQVDLENRLILADWDMDF